jgi:hypothetical protein
MRKIDVSKIKTLIKDDQNVLFYFQPAKEYSKIYPDVGSKCKLRIYKKEKNAESWYVNGVVDEVLDEKNKDQIILSRGSSPKDKYEVLLDKAFNYVSNLQENK